MSLYGILESQTNTGLDSELMCVFSTPLSILSNKPTFYGDTLSLRRKRSSSPAQRWEIETAVVPSNDNVSFLLHSVINGHSESIYVRMPQMYSKAALDVNLSLTVASDTVAGTSTILLAGGATIPRGEFIRFGNANHWKVYLVHESSINSISIFPPLVSAVPQGTPIIFGSKVTMRAVYDMSVKTGVSFIDGILSDPGSLQLIEDF